VREYIAANLEGDLTIAQLAKVACLSHFHFARAFKTAVGQSPHQYVSAHRLERAKEMLTRGDQPLLDIAIALNFSSQANFTRAFRLGTGMTPGQFRRDFAAADGARAPLLGVKPRVRAPKTPQSWNSVRHSWINPAIESSPSPAHPEIPRPLTVTPPPMDSQKSTS
jgi:AraC-like DNA-binding protein